jgi:hypothetical protein
MQAFGGKTLTGLLAWPGHQDSAALGRYRLLPMFCLFQGDGPSEGEVPPWRQALFRHINVLFASALSVAKNTFIVTWSPVSQTLLPVVSLLIAEFAHNR